MSPKKEGLQDLIIKGSGGQMMEEANVPKEGMQDYKRITVRGGGGGGGGGQMSPCDACRWVWGATA